MNTNAIIGVLVALAVIGGGWWYFSWQSENADVSSTSETSSTTFGELIARAGSWTCEVRVATDGAPSVGVTYIADGKIRADFTSTVEAMGGTAVTSHMIQADGYIYTWSDMAPQGMKMKTREGEAVADVGTQEAVPHDASVDYTCAPWAPDASQFVPPENISFMELGASGMPAGLPEGFTLPQY